MFKRLVRRLLTPIVNWANNGDEFAIGCGRDEDGVYVYCIAPLNQFFFNQFLSCEEARNFARALLGFARDHQEGVPLKPGLDRKQRPRS